VSAFEVYRKVYSNVITPARVAELLILREDMPRSLANCVNEVVTNLASVRNDHSRETERRAGLLQADLHYGRIDAILQQAARVGSSISPARERPRRPHQPGLPRATCHRLSMRLAIHHETAYRYTAPAHYSIQQLR